MALTYVITLSQATGPSLYLEFTAADAAVNYTENFNTTVQDANLSQAQLDALIEGLVKPSYDAAVDAFTFNAEVGTPISLPG